MAATAMRTELVRLSSGRFAIPANYCEALGITDDTLLRVVLQDGELRITADGGAKARTGSSWLRELYDYYAPVRAEILARGISQEELYADIDEAIEEVRAEERARLAHESRLDDSLPEDGNDDDQG